MLFIILGRTRKMSASSATSQGSLLLTVLRDLLDSYYEEERQSQRLKLKGDKDVAQEQLDKLVTEHQDKLQRALDTYTKVDARIRAAQSRVQVLKGKLISCKDLLRCRQDDLRQLWVESVKYKQMLKLFDTIEAVRAAPGEVARYRARKHYLHASETLVYNIKVVTGKLGMVEALRDLRTELQSLRDELYQELLEEIHKHLYSRPKPKPRKKDESEKSREISPVIQPKRSTLTRHTRTMSRTLQMEHDEQRQLAAVAKKSREEVDEDLTLLDPEENSAYYLDILVESLQKLGHTERSVNEIQQRMEREFLLIIEKLSLQVIKDAEIYGWHQHKAKLLATLLEMVFDKFRSIVEAHSSILKAYQRVKQSYYLTCELYSLQDVWTVIQQVLQQVLSEYFAVQKTTEGVGPSLSAEASEVSVFFQRKKWPTGKAKPLYFRFESSFHALGSLARAEQDGVDEEDGKAEAVESQFDQSPSLPLVCQPSIFNVIKTFSLVCDFGSEIEASTHQEENCPLRRFVVTFMEHKFLDDISHEYQEQLTNATLGEQLLKLVDNKQRKMTGLPKKILACVVVVWQMVESLRKLIGDLPMYATQFLFLMVKLLSQFFTSIEQVYKNVVTSSAVVQGFTRQEYAVKSAQWAQNEEITALLRSLPSWTNMYSQDRPHGTEMPQKEDLQLFGEESQMFMKNLVDEEIKSSQVVLDGADLRRIAHVHESVEWFSRVVMGMIVDMTKKGYEGEGGVQALQQLPNEAPETGMEREKQALNLLQKLSKLSLEYKGLAETTVIMLHVETRVHCFFHLAKAVYKTVLSSAPTVADLEPGVERLRDDLNKFDIATAAYLSDPKIKFVFEGVGQLLSTIFIHSAGRLHHVNSISIKKMCRYISTVQQALASKTQTREKELDRAKQFFEVLHLNPQEFMKVIQEYGKVFSLEEYRKALELIGRSQQRDVSEELATLAQVFSTDAV